MSTLKHAWVLWLGLAGAAGAQPVSVSDAWVRATVAGQTATGAFMTLSAQQTSQLIRVSSPLAGVAEIHEMKMEKDVMKMAALPTGLALPAGKAVELKPGGYHIMLMDLKAPLSADATVPLTLTFQDAKGVPTQQTLTLPVRAMKSHAHAH